MGETQKARLVASSLMFWASNFCVFAEVPQVNSYTFAQSICLAYITDLDSESSRDREIIERIYQLTAQELQTDREHVSKIQMLQFLNINLHRLNCASNWGYSDYLPIHFELIWNDPDLFRVIFMSREVIDHNSGVHFDHSSLVSFDGFHGNTVDFIDLRIQQLRDERNTYNQGLITKLLNLREKLVQQWGVGPTSAATE